MFAAVREFPSNYSSVTSRMQHQQQTRRHVFKYATAAQQAMSGFCPSVVKQKSPLDKQKIIQHLKHLLHFPCALKVF